MDARAILTKKRDGWELSADEIRGFLAGYVAGEVPDYLASALLMAVFVRGLSPAELAAWTQAMLESGEQLALTGVWRRKADKHSTGGVGDKVSIPLAPAVASCGVAVPMISGRALGHTGGTLDKLESIPGMVVTPSADEIKSRVEQFGLAFGAQTERLVPADRMLYALRDATGLVESIPLIASSILSKKLCEGLDALVLDVKFGSGAFLPDPQAGAELSRVMLWLAQSFGVRTTVYQTSMARPLGRTVGNALEVAEAIECLRGGGPPDLRELVTLLGGEMLWLAEAVPNIDAGAARIATALDDGSALALLRTVVEAQAGDPACIDQPELLPSAPEVVEFGADREGALHYADVKKLGMAVVALGGGRVRREDRIDPAVGLILPRAEGEMVGVGDPLVAIHHRGSRGLQQAIDLVREALAIGAPLPAPPLVIARLDGAT